LDRELDNKFVIQFILEMRSPDPAAGTANLLAGTSRNFLTIIETSVPIPFPQ